MDDLEKQLKTLKDRVNHFSWIFNKNSGILTREERKEYRGKGISKSSLDKITNSMDSYFLERDYKSPAMIVGSAFHTLVLEPEKFERRYFVPPAEINRRTKAGKEEWAQMLKDNDKKDIISKQDRDMIHRMAEAVKAHPEASDILNSGEAEKMIMWNDKESDVLMKGAVDWLNYDLRIVSDLKSTKQCSLDLIERDIWLTGLRYNVQASIYLDGIEAITGEEWRMKFIFAGKTEPWPVFVVELSPIGLEVGRKQYKEDLQYLLQWFENAIESLNNNEVLYGGHSGGTTIAHPPGWLVNRYLKK